MDHDRHAHLPRKRMLGPSLGLLGYSLTDVPTLRAAAIQPKANKATSCVGLFVWVGMCHLDTWDPKPEAPREIRGVFGTLAKVTSGIRASSLSILAGI